VGVVIATRDRARNLIAALEQVTGLEPRPPIVVVDNQSSDGTPELVRRLHPDVDVIALERNAAASARNAGVRRLSTPYVAFADDDSWWEPDAFPKSVELFEAHDRLGLIAGKVLVGANETVDPTCIEMAASPLPTDRSLPGPRVLGFIACGAIVRRSAFLRAGGFNEHFGVGGEEALLALDLASSGWDLCYVDEIIAHHHPSELREPGHRRRVVTRNALWTSWLRHPGPEITRRLRATVAAGVRDGAVRRGIIDAVPGLPWVVRARRPLPAAVRRDVRMLNRSL
jgi:GT2 family glycosyltransferase